MGDAPILKNVKLWADQYGKAGSGDQRAAQDFMICEQVDAINSFRSELVAITKGAVPDETLDALVGKPRKMRHESYKEWARMMLVWMANTKT